MKEQKLFYDIDFQVYIHTAIHTVHPFGTGWTGVLHLKKEQDLRLLPSQRYIRFAEEMRLDQQVDNPEDFDVLGQCDDSNTFCLIICVKAENSMRLVKDARHKQSDISFKHVAGWLEFELGGYDRVNQCSIGDFLQAISPQDKFDLYEPLKRLSSLSPYEHLERLFRLCFAHYARNIQKCRVSDIVKTAMFSIAGTTHKDGTPEAWMQTLSVIQSEGGTVGNDWLQDKITCKFALPALCWQYSQKIPLTIWQASDNTSNVIEALHQDQLCHGSGLTLVGGLLRGEEYDNMRLKIFQLLSAQHHVSSNFLKRQSSLEFQETTVRTRGHKNCPYNTKVRKILDKLTAGEE
ncbi:hypothetical protein BDP27DRAFT_1371886 [Rhodocollybia butyracea]|uniref:Uncharacterized protein n=1 Tax=Rhodocollybia butyracea TaxID=206335 RepID=A0A9P5TY92_9AGAR|nr:hypothetical protein BDP27DRAFT_1371886 [Rhodocollybia butyracea]